MHCLVAAVSGFRSDCISKTWCELLYFQKFQDQVYSSVDALGKVLLNLEMFKSQICHRWRFGDMNAISALVAWRVFPTSRLSLSILTTMYIAPNEAMHPSTPFQGLQCQGGIIHPLASNWDLHHLVGCSRRYWVQYSICIMCRVYSQIVRMQSQRACQPDGSIHHHAVFSRHNWQAAYIMLSQLFHYTAHQLAPDYSHQARRYPRCVSCLS